MFINKPMCVRPLLGVLRCVFCYQVLLPFKLYYKCPYIYLQNKTSGNSCLLLFTTYSIMEQKKTLLWKWLTHLYLLITLLLKLQPDQGFYDTEDYIWIILTKVLDKPSQQWLHVWTVRPLAVQVSGMSPLFSQAL